MPRSVTVAPLTAAGTLCLSRDVRPANAVLVPLAEASRRRGVASTATIVKHRPSLAITRAPSGTRLPLPEAIVYVLCTTICCIRCMLNVNFNPAIVLLLAFH